MGVTVNRYTPLGAMSFNTGTLGFSVTAQKLVMYLSGASGSGGFRLFNLAPDYTEDSRITTPHTSLTPEGSRPGAITGYLYYLSTGGSPDSYGKIDPLTGVTVATVPVSSAATNMSSTLLTIVTDVSESEIDGDVVALVHNSVSDVAVLGTTGASLSILGFLNGATSTLGEGRLLNIGPSGGVHRWLAFPNGTQDIPTTIYLITWNGVIITSTPIFTVDTTTDNTFFGADIDTVSMGLQSFWDDVNGRLIMSAEKSGTDETIIIALEDDWSTVAWRTTVAGNYLASSGDSMGMNYHQMTQHCAFITANASEEANAYLLRLSDGVVVDSGVVNTVDDLSGTGNNWVFFEEDNSLYLQSNDQDAPLIHIAFDALVYPDEPTFVTPTGNPAIPSYEVDPGFAVRLMQGPVNRIMNGLVPRIAAALEVLVDKDHSPDEYAQLVIDLNGHQLLNLKDVSTDNAPARMP